MSEEEHDTGIDVGLLLPGLGVERGSHSTARVHSGLSSLTRPAHPPAPEPRVFATETADAYVRPVRAAVVAAGKPREPVKNPMVISGRGIENVPDAQVSEKISATVMHADGSEKAVFGRKDALRREKEERERRRQQRPHNAEFFIPL
eukprot:comp17021_c0_seq1/m.28027 comp17021_c0_seq1/g.28027  ORF comp17021_c0_seq1/g.28027 comp17021_c0_seq1/m.28027 type:complete len:147 (+) comp17021_c0_seq1:108-548(+)